MRFLKIVERKLPLGHKAWKGVAVSYNKWAGDNERPERDVKSLETKYKQLLKKKKPTGDGDCPPDVKLAHHVDTLINQRADTCELSDSEFDDAGAGDVSSDDVVEVVPSASSTRTAVARRAPTPPLRHPRMNAPELVTQLSKVFDPKAARARETDRAERSFQTTHMFTLSQQLRDAQTANENLRNQLSAMQIQLHDAQRGRELAELKLQMFQTGSVFGSASMGPSTGRRSRAAIYKENPDFVREDRKVRCERIFPDGGACTQWFSDLSSDDDEEKENKNPSSSSNSRRSSLHVKTTCSPFIMTTHSLTTRTFTPLPAVRRRTRMHRRCL
ncbi:hypothetical protein B0H19DRAFT_532533 [Mycena capillaripes]|nr:hypothetical protein B0H19DRAFT_532533 [Mycena capillaripes]